MSLVKERYTPWKIEITLNNQEEFEIKVTCHIDETMGWAWRWIVSDEKGSMITGEPWVRTTLRSAKRKGRKELKRILRTEKKLVEAKEYLESHA